MKEKKGNQYRVPQNQQDALVLALKLALTAPDDAKVDMAVDMAKDLASNMSEFDIARCKKRALQELNALNDGVQA